MHKVGKWIVAVVVIVGLRWVPLTGHSTVRAPERVPSKGLILDAARQYYSVASIKQFIDQIHAGGGSFLQLHLTDDSRYGVESRLLGQTTRRAIKRGQTYYNRRTKLAFLSKRQLRTLVVYGHQRGVEVIPEIDTPGHSRALIKLLRQSSRANRQLARRIAVDGELDMAHPQTLKLVKRLLHEYTGLLYRNQHVGLGGDEYRAAQATTSPTMLRYTNGLNRDLNRHHLRATLWNDGILRADLPRLDNNVLVLYWSYDSQPDDPQDVPRRRARRASLPDLNAAGFQTINANYSYLYLITNPKMFLPANVDFWQKDLDAHWTNAIWDNWDHSTPALSRLNIGSALSIWGDGHRTYSQAEILRQTRPFLTTYFQHGNE